MIAVERISPKLRWIPQFDRRRHDSIAFIRREIDDLREAMAADGLDRLDWQAIFEELQRLLVTLDRRQLEMLR